MSLSQILVVEDNALIAMEIKAMIEDMALTFVGHAFTGEAGLYMATLYVPQLILMDINLGSGIDGIEAAERIYRELKTRILFLSGRSDEKTLLRARAAGMHGYVNKPFQPGVLQNAVTEALSQAV